MLGFTRNLLIFKAFRQLGARRVGLFGLYRLGLRCGYYRWLEKLRKPLQDYPLEQLEFEPKLFPMPPKEELASALGEHGRFTLIAEAHEILAGQVRLFGGKPVAMQLAAPGSLSHWTAYELGRQSWGTQDVRLIWEHGRLSWVYTLGRAYLLSGDERFAQAFWGNVDTFLNANPPGFGPHWASSQEVALRLIALAFGQQAFQGSASQPERVTKLAHAIADHASRIPPTLLYAHAQDNNHLLIEAAGLYTAGLALPRHPNAVKWRSSGWRWFNHALQTQIASHGAYVQHSTNYHRLVLQAALWVTLLATEKGNPLPELTLQRLATATRWLLALLDPHSGRVPNLGPNDGAYILPLTTCPFDDYRPALQAAAITFLGESPFPAGAWDEMSLWFRGSASKPTQAIQATVTHLPTSQAQTNPITLPVNSPNTLHAGDAWAYLRAAHFSARPGHADQLHLDLWWRGLNLARDAGTYLYNAEPPWDNALAHTVVHNTITLEERDQMTWSGRFLFLDWAQAKLVDCENKMDGFGRCLAAQHDGYRCLGILHRREVHLSSQSCLVIDTLLPRLDRQPNKADTLNARLHWLLPDWQWELKRNPEAMRYTLRMLSPHGWISLSVECERRASLKGRATSLAPQVVRAGKLLEGDHSVLPTLGWFSPTYNVKEPGLSFSLQLTGCVPLKILSEWGFP